MNKVFLDAKAEYYVIFISLVIFIVFNEYAKRIINFYDNCFFIITGVAALPFLMYSIPVLWKYLLAIDYISFSRRLLAVAFLGLGVNIVTVSGVKVFKTYHAAVPVGSAAISCPVLSLNSSRIGYETIDFKLKDKDMSLRVSGKTVGTLEVKGVSGYCVFLELRKGNDYFIVDRYWVAHCQNR